MADNLPPYVTAYGNITKTLDKIISASTPSRFTLDYLSTVLGLTSSSARPVIPFLKRIGFLGSDGVPTDRYNKFRNPSERGKAAAEGLKAGYSTLFESNEFINQASEKEIKGIIVQVTGLEANSGTVKSILGSFKALNAFASYEAKAEEAISAEEVLNEPTRETSINTSNDNPKLGLSYTINLNLPATSDISVFNAIFKSLKENLL